MKVLYKTKKQALKAFSECGEAGYISAVDSRAGLEFDDSLGADFDGWSGETECVRTEHGDIFAWLD